MRDPPLEQLGPRLPRAEYQRVQAGLADRGLALRSAGGRHSMTTLLVVVDVLAQRFTRVRVAERPAHVRGDEPGLARVGAALSGR